MGEFLNIADIKFYDGEGNEFTISDTQSVDIESSVPISIDETIYVNRDFTIPFELIMSNVQMFDNPLASPKIYIQGEQIVLVQVRRHHKKRINKKWLKRYGYKEVRIPFRIDDIELKTATDNRDGTWTFEGNKKY